MEKEMGKREERVHVGKSGLWGAMDVVGTHIINLNFKIRSLATKRQTFSDKAVLGTSGCHLNLQTAFSKTDTLLYPLSLVILCIIPTFTKNLALRVPGQLSW